MTGGEGIDDSACHIEVHRNSSAGRFFAGGVSGSFPSFCSGEICGGMPEQGASENWVTGQLVPADDPDSESHVGEPDPYLPVWNKHTEFQESLPEKERYG